MYFIVASVAERNKIALIIGKVRSVFQFNDMVNTYRPAYLPLVWRKLNAVTLRLFDSLSASLAFAMVALQYLFPEMFPLFRVVINVEWIVIHLVFSMQSGGSSPPPHQIKHGRTESLAPKQCAGIEPANRHRITKATAPKDCRMHKEGVMTRCISISSRYHSNMVECVMMC